MAQTEAEMFRLAEIGRLVEALMPENGRNLTLETLDGGFGAFRTGKLGTGDTLLEALRSLAAEIGAPPEFSESIAGEMGCAACKTGPYETHAPGCRLTKERIKRAARDLATTACEACGGSGDNRGGDCPKCDGTGIGGSDDD